MFVLITNFHSLDNKGDLGIVLGLMDGLLAKCPTIKFGVVGRDLTERAWWEERGVQFFVRPLALHTQKGLFSGFINKFLAVIFIGEYFISLSLIKFNWWQKLIYWAEEKRKTLEAFSHADLIISKGGSFFREPGYYRNILPIGILGHLHQIRLGLALGKKVILAGQSFGPINNPWSRFLLARAFKQCNLITVRESDSEKFLRENLNLDSNVKLAGDTAFLLESKPKDFGILGDKIRKTKNNNQLCVGLTVRSWSNKKEFLNYLTSLSKFVADSSAHFFIMPQVLGPSLVEDDRIVARTLVEKLPEFARDRVTIVDLNMDPAELLGLYGQMDFYLATRLHSSIFALLSAVPVMAIGYEPKTIGIFKDLGLVKFVIDIRDISFSQVKKVYSVLVSTSQTLFVESRQKAIKAAGVTIDSIYNIIQSDDR